MMPESRTALHTATAGASAALFTWAVVLPLDVLRTRVQAGKKILVAVDGDI
jgi:hypothetical protein